VFLEIFLEFLGVFRIFSVALLIYLDISGLFFAQENISKKKQILSFWTGPSPKARPYPVCFGLAVGPAEAHRGRAVTARQGQVAALGVRARHARASCRTL
jgi:hypothetical protein